jgi:hypothetical protein
MPRLTQPSRSQFDDPEDLEAYDAVIRRRSSMKMTTDGDDALEAPDLGEYWSGLINSPRLCAIAAQMGTFVRTAGERDNTFSHADREFVDQVLSADWKTNVVQRLHIPDGVAAGVRLEAVEALHYGREEELNDDERLLARFIRQLVSGTVDEETFAAMKERLGARGVVEYSGFVLWLGWIIRMMQMIGVTDPPDADIEKIIDGLKDGSIEVPNFRERLG